MSEHKHCFIGDNCMFSFDILIRNSDHHLIYDCENNKRINPTKSVFIGDHVWIGQLVNILKGTRIDSGSIVGASSVVAGKKYRITPYGREILHKRKNVEFFGIKHVYMVFVN